MQKNTIIGTALILTLIATIILYVAMKPAPAKAPGTTSASSLPAGGYSEHAPYYDIVTNYATTTPLLGEVGAPANEAAIARMKDFIGNTIATFKNDGNFANLTSEDIAMMGFDQGRKETLQITYLIASSARTLSYIFTIYEDTLGAHGNTFFHTFTFDTKTGAPLGLNDIFLPSASYLDTLSSISRAKLPAVIGESADTDFMKGGTTPDGKNFENFFFDNRDFVILFPPYQVAPYAAGSQTLRISLSQLSNILKPEYR
jgi:hypothetical protein